MKIVDTTLDGAPCRLETRWSALAGFTETRIYTVKNHFVEISGDKYKRTVCVFHKRGPLDQLTDADFWFGFSGANNDPRSIEYVKPYRSLLQEARERIKARKTTAGLQCSLF